MKGVKEINKQLKAFIHRKTNTMDKKKIERQENLNVSVIKAGNNNNKLMSSSIITCKSLKKTGILTNSLNVTPQKAPDLNFKEEFKKDAVHINERKCGSLAKNAFATHIKRISIATDIEIEKRSESKRRRSRKDRKDERRKNCQSMYSQYLLSPSGVSISAINLNDSLHETNAHAKGPSMNESVPQRRVVPKAKKLNDMKNEKANYQIERQGSTMLKQVVKDPIVPTLRDLNAKRYIAKKYLGELYMRVMYKVKDLERNKKLMGPLKNVKGVIIDDQRQKRTNSKMGHISHKSIQYDSKITK